MSKTISKLYFGAPRQSWVAMLFIWLAYALNANTREIINRLMPYITDEYELTATQAGYISSLAFVGVAVASFVMPRWADGRGWYGWKKKFACLIFAIGYLGFTAVCGVSFITVSFGVILIVQFLRGFFSGAGDACEVASVVEWFPKERAGMALGVHHTSYPWGCLLGGFAITAVLTAFGDDKWMYCWFIFPIAGIVVWLLWFNISNSKNYAAFEKATKENGSETPLGFSVSDGETFVPKPGMLGRCLKNPNITMVAAASFMHNASYIGLMFWMPLYLAFVAGFNYAAAASLSLVFTITGGLGQIIWGTLADKIGTKRVMIICSFWLALAFFLMQFISLGVAALVGFQLLLGCCSNAVYPVMYNFIAKSTEKGGIATGNGIMNVGMFVGAGIATPLVGFLIDLGGGFESVSGYNLALYVMVGMAIIAGLIFILFTREPNGPRVGKDFALVSLESCNLAPSQVAASEKE